MTSITKQLTVKSNKLLISLAVAASTLFCTGAVLGTNNLEASASVSPEVTSFKSSLAEGTTPNVGNVYINQSYTQFQSVNNSSSYTLLNSKGKYQSVRMGASTIFFKKTSLKKDFKVDYIRSQFNTFHDLDELRAGFGKKGTVKYYKQTKTYSVKFKQGKRTAIFYSAGKLEKHKKPAGDIDFWQYEVK